MGTAAIFAPKPANSNTDRLNPSKRVGAILKAWVLRMQQRQQLAAMNTYELRDIGLNNADAYREVHKAPWQV